METFILEIAEVRDGHLFMPQLRMFASAKAAVSVAVVDYIHRLKASEYASLLGEDGRPYISAKGIEIALSSFVGHTAVAAVHSCKSVSDWHTRISLHYRISHVMDVPCA